MTSKRELEQRLADLSAPHPDERSDEPAELTESQRETCEAIVDELTDEELALAEAIIEYAEDVGDPMFHGEYGGGGTTQAGADYLEIVCNPGPSARYIDRERYKEYL